MQVIFCGFSDFKSEYNLVFKNKEKVLVFCFFMNQICVTNVVAGPESTD